MAPPPRLRPLRLGNKLAAITIDFEQDYGDRVGQFNILDDRPGIDLLINLFASHGVPISAFVQTNLFDRYPRAREVLTALAADLHAHSHTHDTRTFDGDYEIPTSYAEFERVMGQGPLGYRAPQGVLHPGDIDRIRSAGFCFSSSIFPSFRPGKFNHRGFPLTPFLWENGLLELPFAAIPLLRYVISLSYLKLMGWSLNRSLFTLLGLPRVIVFDSHLHDYLFNEKSFRQLPTKVRLAWGINRKAGLKYTDRFIGLLKSKGYRFVTMTELYHLALKSQ